jgi:isopentenyl-diphosphate delta-isomerase
MTKMKERKADHIDIVLNRKVTPGYCYWDDIRLVHEALPEIDPDDIDMSARVLGKKLDFPFIVTAITGGFPGARKINGNIAEACADLGIGMGVGSQRAAIEKVDTESYAVVKDHDIPLVIGNVGAPQLVAQKGKKRFTHDDIVSAGELIGADAMAVHLNFLQEIVQPEGDVNSKGCYESIRSIARDIPVIVKETGAGISRATAERLKGTGIKAIDIAGMGGTSFSAVELYRAESAGDTIRTSLGSTFFDWGIPAPVSTVEANVGLPIIASGGIATGLHAACAIALGACCAGAANLVLKEATESADAVKKKLIIIREELRAAMFLTGSSDLKGLAGCGRIVTGKTKEWLQ